MRRALIIAGALAMVAGSVALAACTPFGAILEGVSAIGNNNTKASSKTAVVCDDVHGADCGNNTATVRVDNGQ